MSAPNPSVTLITGSSKGIGKHLVHHFLQKGHIVIGCSRTAPDWSAEGYTHFCANVSNEREVKKLFGTVSKNFGRLDNLINNAGIASMNHFLLTPLSVVRGVFETNVMGTFLFCQEGARLMQRHRYGRIVNLSTVATELKMEGESAYAASKAAVISLTQILARELSTFGITVNSIGPTPIETDLIKNVPKAKMEALIARQAIPRMGTFEDVSNVIDFYLQKESSFITGQNLYLGGI